MNGNLPIHEEFFDTMAYAVVFKELVILQDYFNGKI